MTKIDEASNHTTDLEFHASGFVAKVGGTCTDAALEQFRDYLKKMLLPALLEEVFTTEDTKNTKERRFNRKEAKGRKEFASQICRGHPLRLPFRRRKFHA